MKHAYFLTRIGGVFCWNVRVINRREMRSSRQAWLESKIMGSYNTADSVVRDGFW